MEDYESYEEFPLAGTIDEDDYLEWLWDFNEEDE
jgi:hypothetical protein